MNATGSEVGDYLASERATSYGNRHTPVGGGAITELPKTATGKIQRFRLRDLENKKA